MVRATRKTRHVIKPKLLLDEGLPKRQSLVVLNAYCDIKHIKHDYKRGGWQDQQVFRLANKDSRILVTFNIRDFRPLINRDSISVIGLSDSLSKQQIDKKLTSLCKRLKPAQFVGQFFPITNETKRRE